MTPRTSLDFYYNHNVMNCHGGLGPLFLASGLTRMMNLPFVHLINQFLKDESPVGSPSMYPLHDAVGFFHMERWGLWRPGRQFFNVSSVGDIRVVTRRYHSM